MTDDRYITERIVNKKGELLMVRVSMKEYKEEMTPSEWLLLIAILDGPVLGLLYIIWRELKK